MDIEHNRRILIINTLNSPSPILSDIFDGLYTISEVYNEKDAIAALNSFNDISAVLLNIVEPQLNGYHILLLMKENERLSSIPVLAIADIKDEKNQIKALDLGAEDIITMPFNPKLVLHRIKNVLNCSESMHTQLQNQLYTQEFIHKKQYFLLSEMDSNTGLYNKSAFCNHASELIKSNPEKQYLIIRFDIDHYKVFNDIYGVQEGEKFLKSVGNALINKNKSNAVYGHFDADHFAVCAEASKVDITKYIELIENAPEKNYPGFEIVPRIGIYIVSDPSLDVSIMCDRALLALHSIKGKFSSKYAYYNESMRKSLLEEQKIETEVAWALQEGQFMIYLQPQINYSEKKLIGAEVLVRWSHPTEGIISPGRFISILERNGLISKLDEYVWEQACKQLRFWLDSGLEPVPLSVNISRVDIFNHRLCDIICSITEKYSIPPQMLHLEITESAYMNNSAQLIGVVKELQRRGFIVAMDDFGSGYSSLNTLKDVPVDVLKLDLKFLSGEENKSRGGNILSSIVRMAHWLKLPVIAEGVETMEQAEYLKSISCLLLQGYFFARPMPVSEFEELLIKYEKSNALDMYSKCNIQGVADFWDATAQSTLLFNSFVGGAAIIEYKHGKVEIIRTNDKYFQVLETTRDAYNDYDNNFMARFIGESKNVFISMLEEAIETCDEASCEIQNAPSTNEGKPIWVQTRARVLTHNGDYYIFYLSIENITKQKKLMNDNTTLSQNLSSIMQSIPGGIMTFKITDRVDVVYLNDAISKMFGYTSDEYRGIFSEDFLIAIHPDDREMVKEKLQYILQHQDETMSAEYRHIRKDGSYIWIQLTGRIMRKDQGAIYTCAILMDIDERVAVQQLSASQAVEIETQRATLKTIYDTVPCGIIQFSYVNNSYNIVNFNNTVWKIFGYENREECIGGHDAHLIRKILPDDFKRVRKALEDVIHRKNHTDFEFRIICKEKTIRVLHAYLQRILSDDGAIILHAVLTDITKHKEEELQRYSNILYPLFDDVLGIDYKTRTSSIVFFNQACNITQDLEGNIDKKLPLWVNKHVVPEDRDKLLEFIFNNQPSNNKTNMITYRAIKPDGGILWIMAYMIGLGSRKYLFCNTNITDKKHPFCYQEKTLSRLKQQFGITL